jgi:hypothetical protein
MKHFFRTDIGRADYSKVYRGLLSQVIDEEERAEDLQRQWAIALKHRNAACYSPKGMQREGYRVHKIRMEELEREIGKAKCDAERHRELWEAMDKPKPPRVRKSVLVDGIRTNIEREYA